MRSSPFCRDHLFDERKDIPTVKQLMFAWSLTHRGLQSVVGSIPINGFPSQNILLNILATKNQSLNEIAKPRSLMSVLPDIVESQPSNTTWLQ